MKLQHLTVIFVAIMLPIALIVSAYTQTQVDTLILQGKYDAKLMDAAYDAIKAFDMNTTSNSISNVADTLRADINAAITTFMNSLASSLGVPGNSNIFVKPYVPAILFTLYDGYYIYAPTLKNTGGYEYTLQPYNYYSVRYKQGGINVVINYTLDNYIAVYGYINGTYYTKSGYLIDPGFSEDYSTSEVIYEHVPVAQLNGEKVEEVKIKEVNVAAEEFNKATEPNGRFLYERNETYYIDPESADKYYDDAKDFTEWVKNKLGVLKASSAVRNNSKIEEFNEDDYYIFDIGLNNNPDDITSRFNEHRTKVIKNAVQNNLNYVITAYANSAGANEDTVYNFRLPEIDADEWDIIASNICIVPFVQGMPCGTRFFNNYAIVQSTTNKFFTDPSNIYYVVEGDEYYHRIDCPYMKSENITGFSAYSFQEFKIDVSEGNNQGTINYWRHPEKPCYYCIVGNNYDSLGERDENGKFKINSLTGAETYRRKAYYTAVAREKYRQYTTTNYFN